ncbi:MAG: hypothetical protein J7K22_03890 [Nanoarchaeota archaeon]|nr:hypothetical protein [Nanoarchaeota archaeon]
MKKGQAALEYLLTYGWAILIVIIVGASLYALGVFTPGQWTGKRQTGFAQFRIVDFSLQDDGTLTIVFQNQIGKTVELKEINATYKNNVCSFNYADQNIAPNTIYTASHNCSSVWGNLDFRTSYSIVVDFYYTDPDSGLSHIDSGTLFGSVEPA